MSQVEIGDILPYTQAIAILDQTVFGTNWTADTESDVVVYVTPPDTAPNDVTQILPYPAGYSVAFIGAEQEVQVTLVTPSVAGAIVTITRQTPAERMDLYINTNFTPSMLNNDFGILTLVDQQAQLVNQKIGPRYNYSAIIVDVVDTILPVLSANQFWAKNEDDTGFIAVDVPSNGIAPSNATYVTITDETSSLPNSVNFSLLSPGITIFNETEFLSRSIVNVDNQTSVLNGDGVDGNITIGLADNAVVPGTAGMGIPAGTTAERVIPTPPSVGFRYNSDFDSLEFYSSGTWSLINDDTDGAVLPGTENQLGYYASTGNVISPLSTANDGVLVTSSSGVPSIEQTIPQDVQDNITRLGTISSGVWNGTVITGTYGGTGVNNGPRTATYAGNLDFENSFQTIGNFSVIQRYSGATDVTFPTTGTLATTGGTIANATNIGITDDTTTNATMYPVWVTTNTGFLPATVTSTKFSFNPSTGTLSSSSLQLTANLSGMTTITTGSSAVLRTIAAGGAGGVLNIQSYNTTSTSYVTVAQLGNSATDPFLNLIGGRCFIDFAPIAMGGNNNNITDLTFMNGVIQFPLQITFGSSGEIRTSTSNGNNLIFEAYDVDGTAYSTFCTMTSANTPSMAFVKPSGGLLTWNGGIIGDTDQADAQFYTPINAQTGTTYTLVATDCGKLITLNNASPITVTFPQQSTTTTSTGFWCRLRNIGAGTVTVVKEGAETLTGNITLITNAEMLVERPTTTQWATTMGTATVNMFGSNTIIATLTTSETHVLTYQVGTTCTLLGVGQQCRALTTAGAFAIQKNGVTLSGLSAIVPSTGGSYTSATGTGGDNLLVRGDKITIVANGTLVAVLSLCVTLDFTQQF